MAKKYTFACRDIGMSCGFNTDAASMDALLPKIAEHAKSAHGMSRIDDATMAKVRSARKEA
jgi:predicted small metal-binding protein